MLRALMFDVDGVVVRHPGGRSWDAKLRADLGIDPADLSREFFDVHFGEVLAGRADLYERLDAVLPALGAVSSHELVDYWFTHDASLDGQLLGDLAEAEQPGLTLQLATVQEHHRARFLWESLRLRDRFSAMHYSADLGAFKSEPAFYRLVETRTTFAPEEHCLIDDREDNIEAADSAGWHAFLWSPQSRLSDVLRSAGELCRLQSSS